MLKNGLKFAVAILILLSLVAIPVFGVSFYDSPSIFSENVFSTNRQLGNGTIAFLKFSESTGNESAVIEEEEEEVAETIEEAAETVTAETAAEEEAETAEESVEATAEEETKAEAETKVESVSYTAEQYESAAKAVEERFKAIGYSDVVVEAVDGEMLRVDIAQTSFIDSIMTQVAVQGEWSFVNPNQEVVCNSSMVESAGILSSSNGYYIRLTFTDEGAEQFKTNCAALAASSSSIYFYVDNAFTAIASLSDESFGKTFTFGSYGQYGFTDYGAAALYCAMINEGSLPADMEVVSTEPLAPTTPASVILCFIIAFIAAFVILVALFMIQGRMAGMFAAAALLGDVALMLTFMVNGAFQLNIATVITLFICLILAGVFFLLTVKPMGQALKDKKSIAPVLSGPTKKMNIRAALIHTAIFVVTVIIWMAARGSIIYVDRAVMFASLINVSTYFALIIFPAYTYADVQKLKK